MCGIVGYIGYKAVAPILTNGLEKLEYRGYDSAGVALLKDKEVVTYKAQGKLINLKNILEEANENTVGIGIGHIRWATHGVPSEVNAHPHVSNCERFAIVHNGIIENYKELREDLQSKGHVFSSQTDTETIVHTIAECAKTTKTTLEAITCALKHLQGAYALCIIDKENPNSLFVARKNAPLIVGIGEGENFIASDVPALLEYTKKVVYLDDYEIAELTTSEVKFYDLEGKSITKKAENLPWEPIALSKMGYKHFMLKEIHEQPDVIRQTLFDKIINCDSPILLNEVKLTKEYLKDLQRIQIIACGTSLHAGMVGKYLIEELIGIPVDVEASSEYIYRRTTTDKNTLVIGISQSGETADTITAIRQAKAQGSHVLIITNRVDSTMARDADSLLPVNAGIEVSVAATKSYTAQLLAFYMLALFLAETKEAISVEEAKKLKEELLQIPQKVEMILSTKDDIQKVAVKFHNSKDFIFIARGINFPAALEGALKLKEISYINATGYPAGELKHGPIAMLDETMPVLSILMPGVVYEKVLSNSEEAKAREARMIALTSVVDEHTNNLFEAVLKVPSVSEIFSPILTTIPLQLLSYYIAEFLGKDVDQPRNLAKSVTVE